MTMKNNLNSIMHLYSFKLEGGQSGTYLRLMRASSDPQVNVAKTYRDKTKRK